MDSTMVIFWVRSMLLKIPMSNHASVTSATAITAGAVTAIFGTMWLLVAAFCSTPSLILRGLACKTVGVRRGRVSLRGMKFPFLLGGLLCLLCSGLVALILR